MLPKEMNFDNQKKMHQDMIDLEFSKNMTMFGFSLLLGACFCYFLLWIGAIVISWICIILLIACGLYKGYNFLILYLKNKNIKQVISNTENIEELNTVKKMFNISI